MSVINHSNSDSPKFSSAQSRLSRLPRLSGRPKISSIASQVGGGGGCKLKENDLARIPTCVGCGAGFDITNSLEKLFHACLKCVSIYNRLDCAAESNHKREIRERLEKMFGGVE